MRFAHIADCHIGAWREPKLRDIPIKAFEMAIDRSLEKKADFILISGDLFNTSLPAIDYLKKVVLTLKRLKDKKVGVYIIAGSHDFSPSGKTMIDVLDSAGLLTNVVKGEVVEGRLRLRFTIDEKTGAKISGMLGRKGSLEKSYYEDLDRDHLESEDGFKIFMFHSAITELKPKELEKMESSPVSILPKGFDYYAGGHVHIVLDREMKSEGYSRLVYPGPVFPNSFAEIEKLGCGGFYFYDDAKLSFEKLIVHNTASFTIDCKNKTVEQVREELLLIAEKNEFYDMIVTLRLSGRLSMGKLSEIDFGKVLDRFYDKGAYFVMKNTSGVQMQEFEEVKVHEENIQLLEEKLISEHTGKLDINGMAKDDEKKLVHGLMEALCQEKDEGEKVAEFERRLWQGAKGLIRPGLLGDD